MTVFEKIVVSAHTGCLMVPIEQLDVYAQQLFGRHILKGEYENPIFWEMLREKSYNDFQNFIFSPDPSEFAAPCFQGTYNRVSDRLRCRRYQSIRKHRHK